MRLENINERLASISPIIHRILHILHFSEEDFKEN